MPDIEFFCFKCGAQVIAEGTDAGKAASCPKCGTALVVPKQKPQPAPQIEFFCFKCGAKLVAERPDVGSELPCPDCGTELVVPNAPSSPRGAAQGKAGATQQTAMAGSRQSPFALRRKCVNCGRSLASDAEICDKCGTSIHAQENADLPSVRNGTVGRNGAVPTVPSQPTAPSGASGDKKASERQAAGCLGVMLFIGAVVFVLYNFTSCMETKPKPEHDIVGAYVMAEKFVKDRLKSPGSAKFPWVTSDEVTKHLGDGKYRVESYVDSQNSFGGLVRTKFVCVVEYAGSGNWRLVSLDMD